MHYGQIMIADSANGAGIRLTLFVSGCTNHCPGCFQPETWDFSFGEPYTQEVEDKILDELQKPYYDGLTILGGEPFEIENQPALLPLIKRVHEMNPKRTGSITKTFCRAENATRPSRIPFWIRLISSWMGPFKKKTKTSL